MKSKLELHSSGYSLLEKLLLCIGALSYPLILATFLYPHLNMQELSWDWGIASEHGEFELYLVHWDHFIGILFAAIPLSIISSNARGRLSLGLLVVVPLFTALPYLVQPTWQYNWVNDSWLSGYAFQLDGLKIVVAPILLAAVWRAVVWLVKRRG